MSSGKFKTLVDLMAARFPGLVDGEQEVNGGDLVDYVHQTMQDLNITCEYESQPNLDQIGADLRKIRDYLAEKTKNHQIKVVRHDEGVILEIQDESSPIAIYGTKSLEDSNKVADFVAAVLGELGIKYSRSFK